MLSMASFPDTNCLVENIDSLEFILTLLMNLSPFKKGYFIQNGYFIEINYNPRCFVRPLIAPWLFVGQKKKGLAFQFGRADWHSICQQSFAQSTELKIDSH